MTLATTRPTVTPRTWERRQVLKQLMAGMATCAGLGAAQTVADDPTTRPTPDSPLTDSGARDTLETRARARVVVLQGAQFLERLWDHELQLLPEFPGSTTYWLYHDNYLASKALATVRPGLARALAKRIREFPIQSSGKVEILFEDHPKPLLFRHHQVVPVTQLGEKVIQSEAITAKIQWRWKGYADLLCYAAIASAVRDPAYAHKLLRAALAFWDGVGMNDQARAEQTVYATYKLALCLWAAHRLNVHDWVPQGMITQLLAQQNEQGGFRTDFNDQRQPMGQANVETTALVMMAWDRWNHRIVKK